MGALLVLFSPELILLSIVVLAILVFLLLHIRSFVRNTLGAAALLFAWAMRTGFLGFVAYIAAWVFMFPVIAALCVLGGVARTWMEVRFAREVRREARRTRRDARRAAGYPDWKPAGEILERLAPPPLSDAASAGSSRSLSKLATDADRIIPIARKSDAGRMVMLVMMAIAAFAVAAGLLVYLNRGPEFAISAEVVARLPPKFQLVARRLVGEPCNRTLEADLVSGLLEQVEYSAIVAFSEQTTAKCGSNEELLAAVVTAQLGSSDFVAAERTADQLVVEYPADPNVFGWRAEAREKRSNFAGAYADMRTALSLFLDPSDVALSVYYGLARLAAKAGYPCEAVVTLRDYVAFDPEKRRTQQLTTLMRGWQKDGSCAPPFGTGSALLRFDPNATAIIVPVEVNGVQARMVVDTGASRTALSKQLASRAGIEPSDPQGAIVTTPLGKTWLPGGRADHISLGGARLSDVPVFIQNSANRSFGDGVDGLLGLSFLGNFHVRIGGGALELRSTE